MENYKTHNENKQSAFEREDAYLRAQKRIKKLKGFYWHAFWYVVINILLIIMAAINQKDGNIWHFGTFSTPIFWGIGLAFHALGVFGKHKVFSKEWEERKMKEYLDNDKKRWE